MTDPAALARRPVDRQLVARGHVGLALYRHDLRAVPRRDPVASRSELYEAAELDGASKWQQFWAIIFPGIRRVIGLSFILAIAGSLSVFEIPFIMTGGANGSATFVIQTLQTAFSYRQVGLASAMAVVLLLIVLVVTWIQRKLFPDEKVDLT